MYGVWHDGWSVFASLCLIAASVKMMDDVVDSTYDLAHGERTLSARLGKQALPYMTMLAVLAATLDVRICVAVLLACYATGMLSPWPNVAKAWVRRGLAVLAALAISCAVAGYEMTGWALVTVMLCNWIDDLMDVSTDKLSGQSNIVLQFGEVQASMMALAALLAAILLNTINTILALMAVAIIKVVAEVSTKHLWKSPDESDDWNLRH